MTIPTEEFTYEIIEGGFIAEITDAPLLLAVVPDTQYYIESEG